MGVCSVLVIDDEPMICDVIQQALGRADFRVETAGDAFAGIAKFDEGVFDVVITDVQMPKGDGYVVVRHIRNSVRSDTPVIGLSGTPWLLKDDCFDRVMEKPFKINQMVDTVRSLTTRCGAVKREALG